MRPSSPSPAPTASRRPRRSSPTSCARPGGTCRWAATSAPPSWTWSRPRRDRFHVIEMSSFQIELTPSLRAQHRRAAQRLARSPRPARHDGALRGPEGAPGRGRAARRHRRGRRLVPRHRRAPAARRPQLGRPRLGARARAAWLVRRGHRARRPRALDRPARRLRRPRRHRLAARPAQHPERAGRQRCALILGVSPGEVAAALATFPGLPHRLEEIGRVGRVLFINDSKATNADSTATALAAFERDVFWILGGKPKQGGITSLEPFFPRIARAYLIGEASEEFAATLEGKVAFERCGTLDVALARGRARCGSVRRRRARARRAALPRLRLLRPVPQLRGPRRPLPHARRRPAGHRAAGSEGMTTGDRDLPPRRSVCLPLCRRLAFDTKRGRAMRPRLSPAIAGRAMHSTAGLSRWTHRVGVNGGVRDGHPNLGPPSDLARLSACASNVAMGELSPWRPVLPPRHAEGDAFGIGGGEGMGGEPWGARHEAVAGGAEPAGRLVVHGRPGAAGRHSGHHRRGAAAVAGGEPVDCAAARAADVLFRRAPCRLCAGERRPPARGVAAVAGGRAPSGARRAAGVAWR